MQEQKFKHANKKFYEPYWQNEPIIFFFLHPHPPLWLLMKIHMTWTCIFKSMDSNFWWTMMVNEELLVTAKAFMEQ